MRKNRIPFHLLVMTWRHGVVLRVVVITVVML